LRCHRGMTERFGDEWGEQRRGCALRCPAGGASGGQGGGSALCARRVECWRPQADAAASFGAESLLMGGRNTWPSWNSNSLRRVESWVRFLRYCRGLGPKQSGWSCATPALGGCGTGLGTAGFQRACRRWAVLLSGNIALPKSCNLIRANSAKQVQVVVSIRAPAHLFMHNWLKLKFLLKESHYCYQQHPRNGQHLPHNLRRQGLARTGQAIREALCVEHCYSDSIAQL
jgi:hypothetical protein